MQRHFVIGAATLPALGLRAASTATSQARGPNVKTFEIYRYNPEKADEKPHLQVWKSKNENLFLKIKKS